MTQDGQQQVDGEGDFFDRWLAHREDAAGPGQRGASTVPPKWAPRVVAPRPEPAPEPEPAQASPVVPEPVAAPADTVGTTPPPAVEPVAGPVAPAPQARVEPPAAEPAPEPPVDVAPVVDDPTPTETLNSVAEPADSADAPDAPAISAPAGPAPDEGAPAPIRHSFAPRTRARTAVGIGTLLAAAAGVVGVYVAARERDTASIGIAVTLWVLTGIIWAVHSGTSVTRLSVRGGQLQVLRHGVRTTIDLTSSYTPVEVHGRPGRHGWKVVFRRRDMSAFVIDQSMVDAAEFMRVLRYYRPGVDAETT